MPDITPTVSSSAQLIESYGNGGFRIRGQWHTGGVFVQLASTQAWPAPESPQTLTETDLQPAFNVPYPIEILLIGTGERPAYLPPDLRQRCKQASLAVEVMSTGAACRTFNVLLAEGRKVAALLCPLP